MTVTYNIKNREDEIININATLNIDLDPNDFIDLSEEDVNKKFQAKLKKDIADKLDNTNLIISIVENDDFSNFCETITEINDENNNKYIYLLCQSERGDADWYGDYNYLPNPLSKYTSCKKQCECYYMPGSGHGCGTAGIVVKTTKEFLEMMGWEEDMKYKVNRKVFLSYKK